MRRAVETEVWCGHVFPGVFFLSFLLAFIVSMPAYAQLQAVQLNSENEKKLSLGGPDAIAGVDDWLLSNGVVCALISDLNHETGLSLWGGSLIDIGHCGKHNDQWAFNHLMPNMDKEMILRPVKISAELGEGQASITVLAEGHGLQTRSIYRLGQVNPSRLDIVHELECLEDCSAVSMLGLLTLHPHRVLTPYTLSTRSNDYPAGFQHLGFDRFDNASQLAAMLPNDMSILLGASRLGAEIAYGLWLEEAWWVSAQGDRQALPVFSITHPDYTLQAVLSRQPWIGGDGKLGIVEMLQSFLMRVSEGEKLILKQRVTLAPRADVAALTDEIYQGRTIKGRLQGADGRVRFSTREGRPLTEIKVSSGESFVVRLPRAIDEIRMSALTALGESAIITVNLDNDVVDAGVLTVEQGAAINFLAEAPMRVTVIGIDVESPRFHDELMGYSVDGELFPSAQSTNYLSLAGDKLSSGWLPIKPGRYRVLLSRGLEYGVIEQEIEITAGSRQRLQLLSPPREVETPGYVASDFHVHSGLSFDSALPVAERLRSFAAQGGEVLIATEHNRLVDISAALSEHQLEGDMVVMPGVELTGMVRSEQTPFTHGHQNVFPLRPLPGEFSGGLPGHEGRRVRTLIQQSQQRGSPLFQLNHPRDFEAPDPDLAYFENLLTGQAYDVSLPLTDSVNQSLINPDPVSGLRDIDVDLIEVANGSNYAMYQAVRSDWFSLLSQGEKIFGSANSDSHGSNALVAIPVNYVALPKGLQGYKEQDFVAAVRAGNFYGTTGPMLEVELQSRQTAQFVGMGEQISGREMLLKARVFAASWVPLGQLNLYINGQLAHRRPVEAGVAIELPLDFDHDSYLVLEVEGESGGLYSLLAPDFRPYAFSNPLFIDADSDGLWQGPGLR